MSQLLFHLQENKIEYLSDDLRCKCKTKILNENIGYYTYNPAAGREFFSTKTGSRKTAKETERYFYLKKLKQSQIQK